MSGWIKIQRKLFNHYLWQERRKLSKFEAWIDLLQLVSYKKTNSQMIGGTLCKWDRGQYPVSISFLCDRWNWTEKPVRNYLKVLEKDNMISLERSSKWTMLTICNYEVYQSEGQSNGQSKGNQEPIIKEYKELKEEYRKIIIKWIKYRIEKKSPLTDSSILTLCKKATANTIEDFEYVINLSIENGWKGLFWDKRKPKQTRNLDQEAYENIMRKVNGQA